MTFELEQLIPVLSVNDLQESIDFYVEHLGFHLEWRVEGICSIVREHRHVMLTILEQNGATVLWIGVDDILPIYEHLIAKGVTCVVPPQQMSYAHDMRFLDPSGNVLWFGSEPTG